MQCPWCTGKKKHERLTVKIMLNFEQCGDVSFLFPLSPRCALYLGDKKLASPSYYVDDTYVRDINAKILAGCISQVYATSLAELEAA